MGGRELCLLAVAAGQQPVAADAKQHARTLVKRVAGQGKPDPKLPFAIESTIRQLDRYCSWWTQANGFFPGAPDEPFASRGRAQQSSANRMDGVGRRVAGGTR